MPARCDDFFQFWLQHGCLQDQTDVDFFALEPSADGFSNDPKVKVVQLRFLDDYKLLSGQGMASTYLARHGRTARERKRPATLVVTWFAFSLPFALPIAIVLAPEITQCFNKTS
jgi:hypothetical protein